MDTYECIYCGADINGNPDTDAAPHVNDNDAWETLAADHHPSCEWITTRANQRDA